MSTNIFNLNRFHKIIGHSFGALAHTVFYPPSHCLDKRGTDVIYPKGFGQALRLLLLKCRHLRLYKYFQILPEIFQEGLVIFANEQIQYIMVVLLQMLKKVQKHRRRRIAVKNMSVLLAACVCRVEYMAKKLLAKLL